MTSIRRGSLLIVLAHPDDEIFHGGVLAHLSERGVRVTLACATDGEAGKPHPSVGPVEDLGALRVEELRLSCARLGIDEPLLRRFHDSARRSGSGTTIRTPWPTWTCSTSKRPFAGSSQT